MQRPPLETNTQDLVRERLWPSISDRDYLCLGDLRFALERAATTSSLRILDLGCGTSPYRQLFPNCDYRRADLEGTPNIDYTLDVPETIPSDFFDVVLSTQVLEHVREPDQYLRLALRVLKPDGKLVLTTHGMFEEHACPEDYYRWTALGLGYVLEKCGFSNIRSWKVTTQQRASAFLIMRYFGLLGLKRRTLGGLCAALTNRFMRFFTPYIHRWLDRHAGDCRVVESSAPGHTLYVVLMIEGQKPAEVKNSP